MKSYDRFLPAAFALAVATGSQAAVLTFEAADFAVTPVFSNVSTFSFAIDIAGPLVAGASYSNPALNGVTYRVFGQLGGTPSGFPAFDLQRTILNADFYGQGSSLAFAIVAGADLSDGLQLSELSGAGAVPVFTFNGREVGTGRYHPALVELYADGSGRIQNSNNSGGVNPVTLQEVNVDFGEEYISDLAFDPASLTLAPPQAVPLPGAFVLFGSALSLLASAGCRRKKSRSSVLRRRRRG